MEALEIPGRHACELARLDERHFWEGEVYLSKYQSMSSPETTCRPIERGSLGSSLAGRVAGGIDRIPFVWPGSCCCCCSGRLVGVSRRDGLCPEAGCLEGSGYERCPVNLGLRGGRGLSLLGAGRTACLMASSSRSSFSSLLYEKHGQQTCRRPAIRQHIQILRDTQERGLNEMIPPFGDSLVSLVDDT